jgi:Rrf2 family protein
VLSQKAKYALRALLMLARQPQGEMVLVGDIADEQNVPKKFLELILLELRKQGLLFSQRGRGGGYTLARPPAAITFGQVVRIMDGPIAPLPCASITGYRRCADCQDGGSCGASVTPWPRSSIRPRCRMRSRAGSTSRCSPSPPDGGDSRL